jgi:FkbM family methyltransferase
MDTLKRLSRLIPIIEGFAHYANPLHIAQRRLFAREGLMTISDRNTGVTVKAEVRSYQMFGETWYNHDYDVPSCPLRPEDSVIDIGANQGFFSCYAASQRAHVWAFEPSPQSCSRLRTNVERNGFSSRVTISETAVSAMAGKATLLCSDFLGGGANTVVEAHARTLGKDFKETVEVDVLSIDAVIAGIPGRIRLCKMDCEGSELNIVRGISDPSRIDSLALEFHPGAYRLGDLVQAVAAWGTHQVSFSKTAYVMYAVRTQVLSEYADSCR